MVALCRVLAILHFKICMPMQWLAGNTDSLGLCGYDWSSCSMGKANDALHNALVKIKMNGKLFLDESFMNSVLSKINPSKEGEMRPIDAL